MNPSEKYGDEFFYQPLAITTADGKKLNCHEAAVCITPQEDEESTLKFAWQILREIAQWFFDTFNTLPEEERFQIIIAWSRTVRPHQGHIFKIWGFRDRMRELAGCETYKDFVRASGSNTVPMPRWEKDVFEKGRPIQSATDNGGAAPRRV